MKKFLDKLIKENYVKINNSKENKDYLRKAYVFAKENSTDKDTWTGSIIVNNGKIITSGANRFAPGVKQTSDRKNRPKKYLFQDHAERNAIYIAAKEGKKLDGSKMYMPWAPCPICANAIIISGIKTLIIHYDKVMKTPKDWVDDIIEAVNMLLESKIRIEVVTDKIGECEAKFRGEYWKP